ncbi:hypothetical protein [Methylobacterium sp.]|uniref:hypothetical protein n=1 Tax=Methylobacterium sp. TaxID=409 RepID=UPI0025ECEDFF|nr:hypothetical protein [Methylobacterium sp.]MBY0256177.1 hypothetical protein [Methylobacterium sp.]
MRERYDTTAPKDQGERLYRRLTLAFTEAAMRELGDARDLDIPDTAFTGAFVGALGNTIASICDTQADGDRELAMAFSSMTARRALQQALHALADASEENCNEVRVNVAHKPAGRPS